MKTSPVVALISVCSSFASAAVHLTYAKQQRSVASSPAAGSSRRSVNTNTSYNDATYVVNVTVGTPGQAMTLELSTSSSDTFVIDARSSYCTYDPDYYDDYGDGDDTYEETTNTYCVWGSFWPGNSSSCVVTEPSPYDDDDYSDSSYFSTSYNGDSYAYGYYMSDDLTIDGMTLPNLTMGLVNDTSSTTGEYNFMGVLAIGYNDSTSANFPDLLVEQGLINTTAYSIWMDDEAATSGSLLFGAIDTTKFTGDLKRIRSSYSFVDMMVSVVGINATTQDSSPITITGSDDDDDGSSLDDFDSTTLFTATYSPPDTLSILPSEIASQMWEIAGAYFDEDFYMALIGCSAASDTTFNFTIQLGGSGDDGPIITATMSDLVIPADEFNISSQASYYADVDGDVCVFGVQNGSVLGYSSDYYYSSQEYSLGSTLLRRTYSVFDLVNSQVAIAPVVFGASATSDIVAFPSYGATVPLSTLVCSYSSCSSDSGSSSNNSDSTDGEDEDSSDGLHGVLPFGTFLGLILGLGVGLFVLGFVVFLIWRHHRRSRLAAAEKEASVSSAEAGQPGPEMSTAVGNHTSATPVVDQAAPAGPTSADAVPAQQPSPVVAAPGESSADSAPAERVDKGKGPEVAPSLPPRHVDEEGQRN